MSAKWLAKRLNAGLPELSLRSNGNLHGVYQLYARRIAEKLNDELHLGSDEMHLRRFAEVVTSIINENLDGRLAISKISRLWEQATQIYTTAFLDTRDPGRKPLEEEITGIVDELVSQYDILGETINRSFLRLGSEMDIEEFRATVSNFFTLKSFQYLRISRITCVSSSWLQVVQGMISTEFSKYLYGMDFLT